MSTATASASAGDVSREGPIHVAVSRMYSTCVSAWRVPLMNVTEERIGHDAVRADDLVGAQAVLDGHHRRAAEVAGHPRREIGEVGALGADQHEVGLGSAAGPSRR